ncbi:MAG TPA: hypothetical protein VFE37_23210 [Chloroflexota bacterium]|nr:hypothetical protein [Chloroflexota bacterium]
MAWTYEDRLRALGRRIDTEQISSVCVTEVEEGFLVVGLGVAPQMGGVARVGRTLEISNDELNALCAEMAGEHNAP